MNTIIFTMQLCDFPAEILAVVLRLSLSDHDDEGCAMLNLQLVAVCRRLRCIAFPLVYEEAYVDLSHGEPGDNTLNGQWARGGWRTLSNVHLIASLGDTGLVRRMAIDVESGHGHLVGLRHVVEYLRSTASEWPSVRHLRVSLSDVNVDPPAMLDDEDDAGEFAGLALALRAMIPRAHVLDIVDTSGLPVPTFGEQLAQLYHQQLQMLRLTMCRGGPPTMGPGPAAQDGRIDQLGFPLLRSARIHCDSGPCRVLTSAVFPDLMDSLDIQVSAPVWQSISHMELPATTRLKLGILSETRNDTRLPLSFNQLLTNSRWCDEVTLHAFHGPSMFFPGIALTGLTKLVVEMRISANVLLGIIGKLPRLAILIALRSTRDPILADVAIPGPGGRHPVEPRGTKLQTLSYGQLDTHELSDVDVGLYKYFLLKFPSLRWFGAEDELTKKLVPFVEDYGEWYPHLARVIFYKIQWRVYHWQAE
ncbi:hypothetical protein H4R19_000710 [Coemansia spiralis]|nr:hypothetical protein H4R19_000710 [Coemansia spiralis]